ncbi:MAG TPA: bifunctional UDP-sugar hydrolase/5'-nucleotidase [Geminicoccaceae bacterium]|nr:bifunctional UDP-sugar hydrolase/5'-nucleotidase [Geminicoccus sp.]HMU52394.1 bifunctional UDP-sugar hydrolase/5'-nucleotidase [Geminicoccaceae bacterium]
MSLSRALRSASLGAALWLVPHLASAEPVTVKILQINDWDLMDGTRDRGGFSRLLSILEAEKADDPNVLLLHAGDALSPSLLAGIDHGAHMVDLLNRLPLDAFVMGNHEFDFGPDNAKEQLAKATFTIVNSNVTDQDGKLFPGTVESKIIEVGGYKIGIFGLTTPETEVLATPGWAKFGPVIPTSQAMAQKLRAEGADIVIALAHTPTAEDKALQASRLIDLIVSGHDQDLKVDYDGISSITESYAQADYVTAIELEIDRVKDEVVWRPRYRVIDSALFEPSAAGREVIKTYEDKLSKELDVAIGKTTVELDSRRAIVRGGEAVIGNVIADATREAVGADIGITNGGGIRGDKTYAPGTTLLRRDIQTELPFGNRTVKLELTGKQVWEALENGFSQWEKVAGRFPQVSGIVVTADPTRDPGARVVSVTVGGQPLDMGKTYTVATNDFMATGGDGYDSFKDGKTLIDVTSAQYMASQVIDWIAAKGEIAPAIEGRIVKKN